MTALKSDLKTTLEGFRKDQADMRADMERRHSDSQRWTFALAIAAVTIIIGAQILLPMTGSGAGP